MTKLSTVIKGLSCCIFTNCKRCPFMKTKGMFCRDALMSDALDWLKTYQEEKEGKRDS